MQDPQLESQVSLPHYYGALAVGAVVPP